MKKIIVLTAIVILQFLAPTYSYAQGIMQGIVMDSTTREPLVGANVFLQGTALGAATDLDGKYRIPGIPEGTYSVRLSYLGYVARIVNVEIVNYGTSILNASLIPDVIEGNEVIITAQARGQMAAINQQLTSKTIVNVVSEEKIKELPDANAAEAIGRLPGVSLIRSGGEATQVVLRGLSSKFSNITVDGVKIPATDANTRDVDLSTISQGSLAGVELYKSLTADQDADAIAGAVNLVTKRAPSERSISVDLKGDYNRLMNSAKQYDVMARYGERFFDDILGIQIQGNVEKKIRSKENYTGAYRLLRPVSDPLAPFFDYRYNSLTAFFTDEDRTRNGGQVILDINTPDSGSVKLTGIYSGTNKNILFHNRVYPFPGGSAAWDYNYRYTEQGISTVNSSLQGHNFLAGMEVTWSASYAHSKVDNPYDFALKFTDPSGAVPGGVPDTRENPETAKNYATNNFSAAACSTAIFYATENFDKERTGYINLLKKYTVADLFSGELKFGGKYKDRSRWMNNREYDDNAYLHGYTSGEVGAIDSSRMLQSRFASYYRSGMSSSPDLSNFFDAPASSRDLFGKYQLMPLINVDALKLWYDISKSLTINGSPLYTTNAQAQLADYSVTERVSAAYLMNTFNFGQSISLLAGIRVEKEDNSYLAKFTTGGISNIGIIMNASDPIRDSTTNYTETIWLPSAQLTIKPAEYLTFRLAAYKALARPDYNLRQPGFYLFANSLTLGNPNLKDAIAWNYEINTQIYSNTIGLVSISLFYKEIDNLFHQMGTVGAGGAAGNGVLVDTQLDSLLDVIGLTWHRKQPFDGLVHRSSTHTLTIPYNSPKKSHAWGIEFEHQMNTGFLPGLLSNFVLSYNVSITRSETYIIGSKFSTRRDSIPPSRPGNPWPKIDINSNTPHEYKRESEGQPEVYGNIALGYDIGGFSARLSAFYQDQYIQQYSSDRQSDVVVDPFTKLDLALKQQINELISLFLNINNLTNREERVSQKNNVAPWLIPLRGELYGTTADFGIRLNL